MSSSVSDIIPYFIDWRISNRTVWPNGQGRIYQPVKLTEAFDVLDDYVRKEIENEQKSTSSTRSHS